MTYFGCASFAACTFVFSELWWNPIPVRLHGLIIVTVWVFCPLAGLISIGMIAEGLGLWPGDWDP